ncbi:ras-related protein RABC1-like [Magnolia sinica]|uniref:ras-related protein RABC1-like n=1 Tax=Magnolia sinica TaxID=86752 RepID=UPI00265801C6|nr:ras-related protein RABC1-like [Magnolia sinica]
MLVGNKVDKESGRDVMKKEGIDFAREYGCLFLECSAKTRINVQQCFEELVLKEPASEIQDKILFMINNISASNMDVKAKEFTDVLKEQYYPWFAEYMVISY